MKKCFNNTLNVQISETIALVGEKESIKVLESEYLEDEVYLSKAKALAQKYTYMRRTRPDGNCFFRAFSYAYLERLINNREEYEKFKDLAQKSKDSLVALGFPIFTVEDFHDTVSSSSNFAELLRQKSHIVGSLQSCN